MVDTQKDKETPSRAREYLRAARGIADDVLTSDGAEVVYSLAGIGAGIVLMLSIGMGMLAAGVSGEFEKELPGAIEENFSITKIPEEGSCYFRDPSRETKLKFDELPAGDFTEGFSLIMPFMKYRSVGHEVGTFPYVAQEKCSVLKPELILKPEEASNLMKKAKEDFMASQSLKDIRKALQSGEGSFYTVVVPKDAPRP